MSHASRLNVDIMGSDGEDGSPQPLLSSHSSSSGGSHASTPASMRHRAVAPVELPQEADRGQLKRFVRSLKALDVYQKTDLDSDIAIKTGSGGAVSIVSLLLIALLSLSETWSFLSPTPVHSIQVDTRPSSQLQIHLDLTFHALRCSETNIDVMDVSGEAQVALSQNIHRTRLSSEGYPVERAEYEDHAHDADSAGAGGAGPPVNPMLVALGLQGYTMPGQGPDQHADQHGEGCRVRAVMEVNKVAGNIHVALGGAHAHGAAKVPEAAVPGSAPRGPVHDHGHDTQPHIHQFMLHELLGYNCSHTINSLRFGEYYPGVVNPLDGVQQIIPEGTGSAHMQYFLKVVPTLYIGSWSRVDTNQFSATQQMQSITMADAFGGGMGQRIPGVFFVYDLSPFMVVVNANRMPLSTYLTSLFAIVGGILTVAGIVDAMLFASTRALKMASPRS